MRYQDQSIAVLGLGASGEAAAILLHEEGAKVTVLDNAATDALRHRMDRLRRLGIHVVVGKETEDVTDNFRFGVISPGIDPAVPLVQNLLHRRIEMIGELELAYEVCHCPVVAITGTNGKTTTTELVARMFSECGQRTIASGNIGLPFAEAVRRSAELDVMTLEVSSFQLERIKTFRPKIAAWLNFAPDHLDRYRDVQEYYNAKIRIFEFQTEDDWAVVNARDTLPELKAKQLTFSAYTTHADFTIHAGWILFRGERILDMSESKLRGLHNAENLMAALAIGHAWGIHLPQAAEALKGYIPQAHRCEAIRVLDGVEWINDSKATNLDALEKALLSAHAPVVLIAGGKDKGFEFDSLKNLVAQKVRVAILIGEMKDRIAHSWNGVPCEKAATLAEAVELARTHAKTGEIVLLSPGTSSFDMFKSYSDRGDQFRDLVHNLS